MQELLLDLEGALECLLRAQERERHVADRLPADFRARLDDALARAAALRTDARNTLMRMLGSS